ncbi:MAG TPA: hypothetical protein VNO51_01115 [Ilumatobacteraceae bacterium]|nr:hypothetical protein [Ilumatobacteraceae bacterium]
MAINSATIEAERASSSAPNRVPISRSIAIGLTAVTVAIVAIVTLVAYVRSSDTETVRPTHPPAQSRDDIVQDLVDRGLIPSPTPQRTPMTRDDLVQDLVDRGLVPSPTPQPAPLTRDEIVQDLVDRGLVPAASPSN